MSYAALIGLIGNAALLLALGVVYDAIFPDSEKSDTGFKQVLAGVVVGLIGMALMLSSWVLMSGAIFDFSGSYAAAFINGLAWNLLNVMIVAWLFLRPVRRVAAPA